MMREYYDKDRSSHHDLFQKWRHANPNGVFLTFETQSKTNLHGSQCRHLGSTDWTYDVGTSSLTIKRKVCATAEDELLAWAAGEQINVTSCKHCLRDKFITKKISGVPASGKFDYPPLKNHYDIKYADELEREKIFTEGAKKTVTVNAYERDKRARHQCIAQFGAKCLICGMDFGTRYGKFAEGYIHVHHLKSLSSIGKSYKVDPIKDLIPLCPNCHAVIHLGDSPLTIASVQKLIKNR